MARKYQKRYHEYRGRRSKGSVVLKIVIVLLALILLALLVFVGFLGGRVEYTDEGVRFVLPWTEDEPNVGDNSDDPAEPTPPVIIIEDPEEPVESEPTPEPEPALVDIGAVEVNIAQLMDGTAAQMVAEKGGNALVVEMKSSVGKIQWNSATALPDLMLSESEGAAVSDAIQTLTADGLYLVARVNCFRDQALASRQMGGPFMTKGGNIWYDTHGQRWVSPASEEVRTYLTQLCMELAMLGFDEILLECAGYPYFGEVHVLATDELRPEELSAPVELFWSELKTVLEQETVLMSLLVTEDMVVGADGYSGITPELLDKYADRVWVKALEGVDYSGQERVKPFADRIVIVGGSQSEGSWADINSVAR